MWTKWSGLWQRLLENATGTSFAGLPDFMWNGIFQLLITILGGILVAAFTSLYLNKKNEVTRVTGLLVERRLSLYQELLILMDDIGQKQLLPGPTGTALLEHVSALGFSNPNGRLCEYSRVFETCARFEAFFPKLERTILEDKLFLDDDSVQQLYLLQSYFALINGLYLSLQKEVRDLGIPCTPQQLEAAGTRLLQEVGVVLDQEISGHCMAMEAIFVDHINHLDLVRRKECYLTYDFFMSPDGFVQTKLRDSLLIREMPRFMELVTDHLAGLQLASQPEHARRKKPKGD